MIQQAVCCSSSTNWHQHHIDCCHWVHLQPAASCSIMALDAVPPWFMVVIAHTACVSRSTCWPGPMITILARPSATKLPAPAAQALAQGHRQPAQVRAHGRSMHTLRAGGAAAAAGRGAGWLPGSAHAWPAYRHVFCLGASMGSSPAVALTAYHIFLVTCRATHDATMQVKQALQKPV